MTVHKTQGLLIQKFSLETGLSYQVKSEIEKSELLLI